MLQITSISKRFRSGNYGVRDVTLSAKGGVLGLLGRNGAGKTTLMQMIATVTRPTTGRIFFRDVDVLKRPDDLRRRLGYLPQDFGVYRNVTAEKLLDHFAILEGIVDRSERRAVTEGLLRQTNLWDVRRQKLGGYSGGMRQRFGIAIALLGNPKLLIVDEPTAGLDPAERVRFLNLLSELGENSVVILSTHIVEDVSELCTRMAIIDKGRILLEAEPLPAVAEMQGQVWERLVSKDELPAIEREHNLLSTKLLSGRTLVRVKSDSAPSPQFHAVEPDLQDVYFSVMQAAR